MGASWTKPRRLGKEFSGWYLDAACTIPYEGVEEGISELDLYAVGKILLASSPMRGDT